MEGLGDKEIADRFSKRKLLYGTQAISGVLAFILGFLVFFHWVNIWFVYVLAFALGVVKAIDNPTRQTFVAEMVSNKELSNAIALNTVEINVARVLGPTLAGIMIVFVGIDMCFILNGISFIAVLIAL